MTPPRVSALIISYNTRALLLESIASVADEPGVVETIVLDNASGDGSAQAVAAAFPAVRLIASDTNLGFAGGVNRAAAAAQATSHLLVLNADARLERGALAVLVELLERMPRAALASPALRYADGSPQAAAFHFPGVAQIVLDLYPIDRLTHSPLNGRYTLDRTKPAQIDHPLGACMLIARNAWADVGPLDEGYFMYLEEIDWCRRARRRGWQIWHHPAALAVHHAGESTRQQPDVMFAQLWRSRLRYYQRFASPTYNRLVHTLVRRGLGRAAARAGQPRAALLQSVRRLVS